MGITKTDFMRGMQCPKMLWLDRHKPELKDISQETLKLLEDGNKFGDNAMGIFGPYIEVKEYYENTSIPNKVAMAKKTKELLEEHTPVICEAAFMDASGNYCAVDILKYDKETNTYVLFEVKNCPSVQTQHIQDATYQAELGRKLGLDIKNVYVIYHKDDSEQPYAIQNVTNESSSYENYIKDNIDRLNAVKNQEFEPVCSMGNHCNSPYECWYYNYCSKQNND